VTLKRSVFLVFGAMGAYIYLGHLAWEVFKESVFFPFVLALLGLGLILGTVWGQRYWRKRLRPT
jgi:predicted MFS family arabinose efflux permease